MTDVGLSASVIAPAHDRGSLTFAIIVTALGFLAVILAEQWVAPPRPAPAARAGALRKESPAVVNLLTNDATVTAAGFRATMLDLAARGWLRIVAPADEEDELARVRPAATAFKGDSLLPHERLVLQHVMARFTTDRAIPARYLAVDVRGSWWRRFRGLVEAEAKRGGLVRHRWKPLAIAPPVALTVLAAILWWRALRTGDEEVAVIDSLVPRLVAAAVAVAIVVLAIRVGRHLVRRELTHTPAGVTATQRWLAIRQRLVEADFGRMAPSATQAGDRRLAYAAAMCLAEGAAVELPLAREDARRAWSSVGGRARLVRVNYPLRPGYGLSPYTALLGGLIGTLVALRARRYFDDVARQEALGSLYDRFPDQDWLIADIFTGLTALAYIAIVGGLWLALAGAADLFGKVERTGVILRTRRPAEISPMPRPLRRFVERDRYSVFVAVDDGESGTVTAWRSTERTAVPQGAMAVVSASLVLGHVRKSAPVGHRLIDEL
ncbi:MAG: DUF2207 domain-containing protein [Ilumatobacteraceae bacterium]|nr:DUF2207 domain-containing protein [Ilumatobacteraceae bacterium]